MMHEILEGRRIIEDEAVATWTRKFENPYAVEVEVGTTGFRGRGARDKAKTYIRINNHGCGDIDLAVRQDPFCVEELEVVIGNDQSLTNTIQILKYITHVLEEEAGGDRFEF